MLQKTYILCIIYFNFVNIAYIYNKIIIIFIINQNALILLFYYITKVKHIPTTTNLIQQTIQYVGYFLWWPNQKQISNLFSLCMQMHTPLYLYLYSTMGKIFEKCGQLCFSFHENYLQVSFIQVFVYIGFCFLVWGQNQRKKIVISFTIFLSDGIFIIFHPTRIHILYTCALKLSIVFLVIQITYTYKPDMYIADKLTTHATSPYYL